MAEEQAAVLAAAEGGEGEAQVLDIDPAQLAALLAQSADGTAQLIDEHGNTITLTAEQLAEAGIDLQNLEGAQVIQLAEGQQYMQGEDGQIYVIAEDDGTAIEGYVDPNGLANAMASGTAEAMDTTEPTPLMPKSQLEHRYPQSSDQSGIATRSGFGSPTSKQLQVPAPIMAAPKPIPTAVQQQQQATPPRRLVAGSDHDQHLGGRRGDQLQSPPRLQYARRPISDHQQQQQHVLNASVNNIPGDRFASPSMGAGASRRQAYAGVQKQPRMYIQEGDNPDMEMTFIQSDEMPMIQGGQMATNRYRQQQQQPGLSSQALRRGNFQSGLLPFLCDQCPRRFAHDHHLKRHQDMAHAKKRPFFCRYCNRDLYLASDLHFQGHLRMQHKQELNLEASFADRSGQQQLQLRTAGKPMGASPSQAGATAGVEEHEEEEPDWDTLDAEKQREVQASEDQQNGIAGGQEPTTTTEEAAAESLQEQPGGDHKCEICDKEYASLAGLMKHKKDDHGMEVEALDLADVDKQKVTSIEKPLATYQCDVCQKFFGKQEYLDKHKIAHTDQQPFPCQYCPRRFKWKENLVKHISWHMDRMPFKCSLCPKGFPTQTRLDVHVKAKHLPKQREHVCPICSKAFYEKEYLAKHMRIHGSKIYPCTECDKKFIDEKFLRRHMMSHNQTRDFACDVCGKAFNKAVHLKSHRTIHTGERPYKCSKCQLAFGLKHNLRAHEKTEHGPAAAEKTHICEYCGRGFAQKNNLDVHLRVHRGVKPFQCTSCLKQFSRLDHLRTHVNAHAGIRDHQCTVCEKYFASKSNLRQHLLVHQEESERVFQCGSCPRKFKQRQHLAKHVKMHTKNADVQYVVIWEKGGTLMEATIITDGVAQDATGESQAAAEGVILGESTSSADKTAANGIPMEGVGSSVNLQQATGADAGVLAFAQQPQGTALQISDVDAAKLLATAGVSGGQVLDLSQLQLVDEEGNPIQGLSGDQLLILQDGTLATTGGDGTTAVAAASSEATTVLDPNTLLALAAEGQGEDGTIYISEENLQALAQQGVVFSYEEAAQ